MKILALVAMLVFVMGCKNEQEKAQDFYESGRSFLDEKNYTSAELEFKNAIKLNAYHTDALFGVATIYELKKRWNEFESTLVDILEIDPAYSAARVKLTSLYLGQNKIDKALSHTEKLLEQEPGSVVAKTLRAAVLFKIDDTDTARRLLTEVLSESPNYTDAVVLRAHDLMSQGDSGAAVKQLDMALKGQPESIVLNIVMLQALSKGGDYERSLQVYRKLIEIYPENKNIPMSLARLMYRNGKTADAIELLEQQAQLHGDTDFLFKAIEIVNDAQGIEAAEAQTKAYLQRFPELVRLSFALVDIFVKNDKADAALQHLEKIWTSQNEPVILIEAGLRKARLELIAQKPQAAKATIDQLVQLDGANPKVVALHGDYLIAQKDEGGAIRTLRSALRQSPNNADIAITLAKAHEAQGDWGLANEYYATAIRAPGGIQYGAEYAEYLVKRDELIKAEQLLQQLMQHGMTSKKVFRLLAQIKLTQGEWQEVEQLAAQIEKDMGEGPETAYIRGLAASGKQDFVAAAEAMERLQSMAPNSVRSMVLLVDAYIRAGKREEAEDFLNRVIATDPGSFYGFFLRGNLRAYYREWALAEQDYRVALEHNPKNEQVYDTLARLHVRQGDLQAAAGMLEAGLAELPESVKLTAFRAELMRREGDSEGAIGLYQTLLKRDNSVDVVANNLAALLLQKGDDASVSEAVRVAERFRQSQIPQYLDTLGWAYVLSGQYEDGLSLLRRASNAMPEAAEIHYHLAAGYYRSGDVESARRSLERALLDTEKSSAWYQEAAALQKTVQPQE